jgi:hypothetical protein
MLFPPDQASVGGNVERAMTRDQIISATLGAMRRQDGLLAAKQSGDGSLDEYEAVVLAALAKRVPEGDISTCEDLRHLGVECCNICHTFYPHYEMYLEDLPDGRKAWVCCSVRFALLRPIGQAVPSEESLDLERALSGSLPENNVKSQA